VFIIVYDIVNVCNVRLCPLLCDLSKINKNVMLKGTKSIVIITKVVCYFFLFRVGNLFKGH